MLARGGQGARGAGVEGQGREAMAPVLRGERRGGKGRTVGEALGMLRKEVDGVVEGRRVCKGLRGALQGLQEGGRLVLLRQHGPCVPCEESAAVDEKPAV